MSAAAAGVPAAQERLAAAPEERASPRTWLAVLAGTLGAFLAVLNIQIVNSSLADIRGAIGAGLDEGGWIATAYLIAEIIVIPLSAWLVQIFSLRRYLIASTALFLLFSVGCALVSTLPQMIVMRAFQGFFGGVLIPLAFTIIITRLPKAQRSIGLALFAVSATFAPAIGPTIGGYLNEQYGWEWVFLVNLAPGAVMLVMLWFALDPAPMRLDLLRQGDWPGILTMAVGLGALQTVLEDGNRNDWFGSPYIVRLSLLSAASLILFLVIELRAERPLVNLRLLRRRNFGFGTLANFLLGIALYGSAYLLPLYLSQIQGYNAMQIGEVLAWYGLPQLAIIPFVPWLMQRFDGRLIVAVGFVLFAGSNFMNVDLSADIAGDQLFLPNIVRAVGQALVLTPLTALASGGIEPANAGSASALLNMLRNLGGAFGIAGLQTFVTKREQFHSAVINEHVSLLNEATRVRLAGLQQYFLQHGLPDPAQAWHQAAVALGRIVRTQSYVMAYGDAFFAMGVAIVIAIFAVLLLKRAEAPAEGAAAH